MPGSMPATSQLDWLISMTAMIVLFWSRATRDLLKSFGWGIAALHRLDAATKLPCPRRPPHSIFRSRQPGRCGNGPGSARILLLGEPFHRTGGQCRFGASRCCLALGLQLLVPLAIEFIDAPAVHVGIEHFQGPAAGVDLVVMGEIGKPFEDAEQVVVPEAAQDLHIAGAALRAEGSEPRPLVAT